MASPEAELRELMRDQKRIEAEITEINDDLARSGVGAHGDLVTPDGFPRDDIDVMAVRHQRHQLACLQTDHLAVMKRVEELLPVVFAIRAKRREGEAEAKTKSGAGSAGAGAGSAGAGTGAGAGSGPPTHGSATAAAASTRKPDFTAGSGTAAAAPPSALPEMTNTTLPLAFVKGVAPGSPASEGGFLVGDFVLAFGTAHALNSTNLASSVMAVLRNSAGHQTPVVVRRRVDGTTTIVKLSLPPKGGRSLGLHIIPNEEGQSA